MGCVYVLTSPSGKHYVGLTQVGAVHRFYAHKNRRSARPLSRAIAKYGWDAFTKEIVFESADKSALVAKEIELIGSFGCMVPRGYNCTAGGEGLLRMKRPPHVIEATRRANLGRKASEETKAKLRAAHARNPRPCPMAGKKHSPEAIAKMRGHTRRHTSETREKMSRSRMGHFVSQETREKLRRAASSQSEEVRRKIADGMRRVWSERRANA